MEEASITPEIVPDSPQEPTATGQDRLPDRLRSRGKGGIAILGRRSGALDWGAFPI